AQVGAVTVFQAVRDLVAAAEQRAVGAAGRPHLVGVGAGAARRALRIGDARVAAVARFTERAVEERVAAALGRVAMRAAAVAADLVAVVARLSWFEDVVAASDRQAHAVEASADAVGQVTAGLLGAVLALGELLGQYAAAVRIARTAHRADR